MWLSFQKCWAYCKYYINAGNCLVIIINRAITGASGLLLHLLLRGWDHSWQIQHSWRWDLYNISRSALWLPLWRSSPSSPSFTPLPCHALGFCISSNHLVSKTLILYIHLCTVTPSSVSLLTPAVELHRMTSLTLNPVTPLQLCLYLSFLLSIITCTSLIWLPWKILYLPFLSLFFYHSCLVKYWIKWVYCLFGVCSWEIEKKITILFIRLILNDNHVLQMCSQILGYIVFL